MSSKKPEGQMLSAVSPDSRDGPTINWELHGGLKAAGFPPWDGCFLLVHGQGFSQSHPLHREMKADGKITNDFAWTGTTMGFWENCWHCTQGEKWIFELEVWCFLPAMEVKGVISTAECWNTVLFCLQLGILWNEGYTECLVYKSRLSMRSAIDIFNRDGHK